MGDKSKIEWTDATWNPVLGCSKVSPGCDNCYAISMSARIEAMGNESYEGLTAEGDWTGKIRLLPERLDQPLRWTRPRRVFVNSMSDLFHPDVPNGFIVDVWTVMAMAVRHQFQILTKRPQRMATLLNDPHFGNQLFHALQDRDSLRAYDEDYPFGNVWLGTSIETDRYTFRANHLRETPAAIRFLSLEPLLGPLPSLDLTGIDWVIVGGESGPGARPMHPDWVRDLRDRSEEAGVAFFFKQWGNWMPSNEKGGDVVVVPDPENIIIGGSGSAHMAKVGKKAAGRELDGRTHDGYPDA